MTIFRQRQLLRFLTALVVAVACFQQSLIPSGWMPRVARADGQVVLGLCASDGAVPLRFSGSDVPDRDGQSPASDDRLHQACPYVGFAVAVLAPHALPLGPATVFHRVALPFLAADGHAASAPYPLGARAPPAHQI